MSLDPSGHIKLSVSDFPKSYAFYERLLKQLGYERVSYEEDGAGWTSPDGFGIWISPVEIANQPYRSSIPGLHHLCFKAESPAFVDKMHKALVKDGVVIVDPPQKYPEYTDDYYAVFFQDPDGIKLEVAYY